MTWQGFTSSWACDSDVMCREKAYKIFYVRYLLPLTSVSFSTPRGTCAEGVKVEFYSTVGFVSRVLISE